MSRTPLLLRIVGDAPVLPRVMNDGVLVDLRQIDTLTDPSAASVVSEVWLAAGPHPGVRAALQREGLRIGGTRTLAATQRSFRRDATLQAVTLAEATAVSAVLLTLLAIAAAQIVGTAARRRDWTALIFAGVPARRLRRLSAAEFVTVTCAGILLGAVAGTAGFVLTAPGLPLLTGVPAPPPKSRRLCCRWWCSSDRRGRCRRVGRPALHP